MSLRWFALLFLCSCVTPQPQGPPPPAPESRSAVDAVMRHATELGLSDTAYTRMVQIDQERESKFADFHAAIETEKNKMTGPPPINNPLGSAQPTATQRRRKTAREQEMFDAKADELDAEAFYSAEGLMTPEQIEKARAIASAWRDELMIWRAAMKARNNR